MWYHCNLSLSMYLILNQHIYIRNTPHVMFVSRNFPRVRVYSILVSIVYLIGYWISPKTVHTKSKKEGSWDLIWHCSKWYRSCNYILFFLVCLRAKWIELQTLSYAQKTNHLSLIPKNVFLYNLFPTLVNEIRPQSL